MKDIRQIIKETIDKIQFNPKGEHNDSPENLCPKCHVPMTQGMGADIKHCPECGYKDEGQNNQTGYNDMTNNRNMGDIFEHLTQLKLAALMESFIRNENNFNKMYASLAEDGFVPINESNDLETKRKIIREMVKDGKFTKDMLKTLMEHNHIKVTLTEDINDYSATGQHIPQYYAASEPYEKEYKRQKRGVPETGHEVTMDDIKNWNKEIKTGKRIDPVATAPDAKIKTGDEEDLPIVNVDTDFNDEGEPKENPEEIAASGLDILASLGDVKQARANKEKLGTTLQDNLIMMKGISSGINPRNSRPYNEIGVFPSVNAYIDYVHRAENPTISGERVKPLSDEQKEMWELFKYIRENSKLVSPEFKKAVNTLAPPVEKPEVELAEAKNKQLRKGTGKSELQLRAGTKGKIFEERLRKLEPYKKVALLEFLENDPKMLDEQDYQEMSLLTGIHEDDIVAMRIEYEGKNEEPINEITYPVIGGQDVRGENEKNAKKQQDRDIKQATDSQKTIEDKGYELRAKKFNLTDIDKNIDLSVQKNPNRGQEAQVGYLDAHDGTQKEKYEMQADGDTNPRAEDNTEANVGDGKVYGSTGKTDVGDMTIERGEKLEMAHEEEPIYSKEDVPMRHHPSKMGINKINEDLERMKHLVGYDSKSYASPRQNTNPNTVFEETLKDMRVLAESVDINDRPTPEQLLLMEDIDFKGEKAKTDGKDIFNHEGKKLGECGAMEECSGKMKEARGHELEAGQEINPKQLYAGTRAKKHLDEYDASKLDENKDTGKMCSECGKKIYETKDGKKKCSCSGEPKPEKENVLERQKDRMNKLAGVKTESKHQQLKHSKGLQLKTGTQKEEDIIDEAKNKQLQHSKGLQLKAGTKQEEIVEGEKKKLNENFNLQSLLQENTDELTEGGRGDFQQKVRYLIYANDAAIERNNTLPNYLGYLESIEGEDEDQWNNMYDKWEVLGTPSFAKFAQEKGVTTDDIGRIGRERYATIDGNELDKEYYAPSDSNEWFDPKTNTFYNMSGQQLRNPEEYDRSRPEYTPFGDEGDY